MYNLWEAVSLLSEHNVSLCLPTSLWDGLGDCCESVRVQPLAPQNAQRSNINTGTFPHYVMHVSGIPPSSDPKALQVAPYRTTTRQASSVSSVACCFVGCYDSRPGSEAIV